MSLHSWEASFANLTLLNGGDDVEKEATRLGICAAFPNYEKFWRNHVAPATNRPTAIDPRSGASPVVAQLAMRSYGILAELVRAEHNLGKIRGGDLGGAIYRNCTDAIKADGDALQKFSDLQLKSVSELASALGLAINIWPHADWISKWSPSREKIVSHRNFLTHSSSPSIMLVQGSGTTIPYVLKQDYMTGGAFLTWPQQQKIYATDPQKWAPLADVCATLHLDTMAWLNNAYAELNKALDPLRSNAGYQRLWGWDLTKPGAGAWQNQLSVAVPIILTGPSSSSSQLAQTLSCGSGVFVIQPPSGQAHP